MSKCGVGRFPWASELDILSMLDRKAKPMPQFVFTGPWSWLSYRVGWLFGVGVTKVAREARYLTDRTRDSSALERTAWLYRCGISCALVVAEFLVSKLFFD